MDERELRRAAELCERAGVWLIMDNTYEHFVYGGRQHVCIAGPHILHLFSFSKVRFPQPYGGDGPQAVVALFARRETVLGSHTSPVPGQQLQARAIAASPGLFPGGIYKQAWHLHTAVSALTPESPPLFSLFCNGVSCPMFSVA